MRSVLAKRLAILYIFPAKFRFLFQRLTAACVSLSDLVERDGTTGCDERPPILETRPSKCMAIYMSARSIPSAAASSPEGQQSRRTYVCNHQKQLRVHTFRGKNVHRPTASTCHGVAPDASHYARIRHAVPGVVLVGHATEAPACQPNISNAYCASEWG